MKLNIIRLKSAFKASAVHFCFGLLIAILTAWVIFSIWYPYPYRELSGGKELFIILMSIDIICGPLLTFVLFSPTKQKKELRTDISVVVIIQILALIYGIWNIWLVRPLYVVQEADRLTIITRVSLNTQKLAALPIELQAPWFGGPKKVSLRSLTPLETEKIIADIKAGGNDSAERPDFYITYDGRKAYQNGRPLSDVLKAQPNKQSDIDKVVVSSNSLDAKQLHYVYIVGRYYWLAVLNPLGDVVGYINPE